MIEGKRKKAGQFAYQTIQTEIITLADVLNQLGLDLDQLIVLAILIGTDYNPGGIRGIGPKTAWKLVKESPSDFEMVFEKAKWKDFFPELDWKEIFYTIKKIPVTEEVILNWEKINSEKLTRFLVEKHDFNWDKIKGKIEKLIEVNNQKKQVGLSHFF